MSDEKPVPQPEPTPERVPDGYVVGEAVVPSPPSEAPVSLDDGPSATPASVE